jgi:hypothetical protein
MDGDLNRLKELKDAAEFASTIEAIMASELTNDFWTVTLPSNLDSSSARNPELFAYTAAQNRLSAPVLFSHKKVSELLDPAIKTKKKSLERHHLFPRAWLERHEVKDLKRINQLANFALLEWPDNIEISDGPPTEYVPEIRSRFTPEDWQRMHEYHALPANWHEMPYDKFLIERRKLMAAIIRRGFESLSPVSPGGTGSSATQTATAPEETESWKAALASPNPVAQSSKHNEPNGDTSREEPARFELRRRYWSAFKDHLTARGSSLQCPTPSTDLQFRFPRLAAGVRPWAWMSLRHGSVEVGVTFKGDAGLRLWEKMREDAATLEQELGGDILWEDRPDAGWAYFELSNSSDPEDESLWAVQHAWLQEKLEAIYRLMFPRLAESVSN